MAKFFFGQQEKKLFFVKKRLSLLFLVDHFNLRRGKQTDLLSDHVQVAFPGGEQVVELVPVLLGERPVHRR